LVRAALQGKGWGASGAGLMTRVRTLSEFIGSIGLSTKVSVEIAKLLHQSERDYSTKVSVDSLINCSALVCAKASTKVSVIFGRKDLAF
jgi:hypothetical protein